MKNLFRHFAVIESKFSIKFRFQHCSEQLRNPPSGIFNAQVRAQWSKKKHQSRSLNSTRMCLYAVATCRAAALCEADEWWSSSAGQQATRCFIRHEWDWFQVVIKLSRHKWRVPPPELVVNRKEKFTFNLLTKLKFSCRCGFTALCHPSFVNKLMMMMKLRVATPSVEVNSLNLCFFFSPSRQKTLDRNFIVMQIDRISHFSRCWSSVGYFWAEIWILSYKAIQEAEEKSPCHLSVWK